MGWREIWRLCWPADRCLLCGRALAAGELRAGACEGCRRTLAEYRRRWAGGPEENGDNGALRGMLAAAPYGGLLRRNLLKLKYKRCRHLAGPLGDLLAFAWQQAAPPFAPQVVVPVPLHKERLRQRGYNQSELLARAFARHFGWPVDAGALIRLRDTRAQHSLSPQERQKNLAAAFAASGKAERLAGRRVLLLDDIITTGATIRCCAAALQEAGCGEIYAAAVAGGYKTDKIIE